MSFYVSITCDVPDTRLGPCMSEDSPLGYVRTATEARRRLAHQGWHRTSDGRDICPDCWQAGRR